MRRVVLAAVGGEDEGHEAAVAATNVLWATALKGQCKRCVVCQVHTSVDEQVCMAGGWAVTRTRCWLRWCCRTHSRRPSRLARSLPGWWKVS